MDIKYASNWVSQPDVCRCCLSASGSCDLTIAYVSDTGQEELYHEILQESFGISLSHDTEHRTSRRICNLCIAQLKLAYTFKNQVLKSEMSFNLYYKAHTEHGTTDIEEQKNKCKELENIKEIATQKDAVKEPGNGKQHTILRRKKLPALKSNSITKIEQGRKTISERAYERMSEECCVNSEYDSDTPISKMAEAISCHSISKPKIVKQTNGDDKSVMDDDIIGMKEDASSHLRPVKRDHKSISERKRVKITCLIILRDTNACPFRHFKSWFRCFFCIQDFMRIQSLKEHTMTAHDDIETELQKMKRYPRSLQIEISQLACKLCGFPMDSVATMREHLETAHQQTIYSECVADYKIDTTPYHCHICGEEFHVFRTLTIHMNVHYANFICDVCGRPFLNGKRLKVHYRVHEEGTYPCTICNKVLLTKSSRSNHIESAHSKRILQCHVCKKPMKHYNARVKHMSEVHHITHSFKCIICGREYNVKHYLATHMRQSHGAKDKKCEECGMAFITGHGLKKHMRKHTGEKPFGCDVCRKSYARVYTLKEHLRTHDLQSPCTEKT